MDLLPYVERDDLWQVTQDAYAQYPAPFNNPPHVGLATPVAIYGCPADPRSKQAGFAARSRIAVAFTSYLGVEGKNLTTKDGILFADSKVGIVDIKNGGQPDSFCWGTPAERADMQFGWWYAVLAKPSAAQAT